MTKRVRRQNRTSPPGRRGRRVPLARSGGLEVTEVEELEALRQELERASGGRHPMRWNADPDDVQRSVVQLVLTLVEFIRRLLERQAIRRMQAGTLTPRETEEIGRALMRLEQTVHDLAGQFGIAPDELQLELGPIGKLI